MVFSWLASWVFGPVEEPPRLVPRPLGNLNGLAARANATTAPTINTIAATTDRAGRQRLKPFERKSEPQQKPQQEPQQDPQKDPQQDPQKDPQQDPQQYSRSDYATMFIDLSAKVRDLSKEVSELEGEVRGLEGEVGEKDDLIAELSEKNALLAATAKAKAPEQKETGTQMSSPLGSKRRSPSDSAGPSKPRKRVKLTDRQIASLVKHDGKNRRTGQIINPEGVVAGMISNKFPTTLKNWESKGLENTTGADCYRIAALQALLHVPAVYHLLGNMHRDCKKKLEKCVTCALQDVFQRYWSTERPRKKNVYFNYKDLDKAVLANIPKEPAPGSSAESLAEMRDEEQLDALNYVQFLLEHLGELSDKDLPESMQQVFGMLTWSWWQCEDCGENHVTEVGSPSPILSVFVQGQSTIVNAVRKEMTEAVEIRCETAACEQARIDAGDDEEESPLRTRKSVLNKTPEVLILQQKRFSMNKTGATKKLKGKIDCEEYLNLGPYTDEGSDVIYRLDAVVAHFGHGIDKGHFITTVRARDGFETLNDKQVSPIDDIQRFYYPQVGRDKLQPYILFYSKVRSAVEGAPGNSD
ncbi:hypothetical protein CKM354_000038500 [Cercospora kikuchii]|uniref:USP domain-containing protein n=1 Tax=Cercospora kikuchii TaxID=84275 RepID=A0A9P3C5Q3_9PEZI|nr:uncharacterized protein CKM354_000038500 [Cercospora kikuchii]GIZ36919.1 hypothetical protein CKM354_000038500 [Cercospora kikuchii]